MKSEKKKKLILSVITLILVFGIVGSAIDIILRQRRAANVIDLQNKTRVTLSWWGNDARHLYTMEGVDAFQDKNKDIEVSYRYGVWSGYEKRNRVWMESDNEADVMQINYAWLDEYSKDGKGYYDLRQLSDYIDLSNFTESELLYGTNNGVLNALPIAMNTHTFYYNQDLLDKYGVGVPENWDDLVKLGKLAKKDGKYALGMSKKQLFLILIAYYEQSFGTKVFNEDGTLRVDKDGIKFMLEYYKILFDEHVICPIDSFDRAKYFSGDIIGTMCWISDTKIYSDGLAETGVNVSMGSYPVMDGAKMSGWYIKPATMWAISADTEHPEEAAKLLNYLLNDPYMVTLQGTEKGVPVSDAAVHVLSENGLKETNEYKATEVMTKDQDSLNLMIPNMENEDIIDCFKSGADEYLYGKTQIDKCANDIFKAMNDVIKED